MNRKDASAEDTVAAEAATEEDEAGTAPDEETTTKEEDTENTTSPKTFFFWRCRHVLVCFLAHALLDDRGERCIKLALGAHRGGLRLLSLMSPYSYFCTIDDVF